MKIDYNVIAYVLFVIVTTMTTLSYLYRSERIVAAVTVFILFVLIFTFYGVRWFKDGKSITTGSSKKGPFPPVINTCPDFLSLITRTGSSSNAGKLACVDTMGVSRNQTILKTFKKDVVEPTASEDYFFYNVYTRDMTNTAALKTAADNAMLSWEGITTS